MPTSWKSQSFYRKQMKAERCGEPEKASRSCCTTSEYSICDAKQTQRPSQMDVVVQKRVARGKGTKRQGIGSAAFWIKYGRPIASRLGCYLYNHVHPQPSFSPLPTTTTTTTTTSALLALRRQLFFNFKITLPIIVFFYNNNVQPQSIPGSSTCAAQ